MYLDALLAMTLSPEKKRQIAVVGLFSFFIVNARINYSDLYREVARRFFADKRVWSEWKFMSHRLLRKRYIEYDIYKLMSLPLVVSLGIGICDYTTGQCKCFPGSHGDNCGSFGSPNRALLE